MDPYKVIEALEKISETLRDIIGGKGADYGPSDLIELNQIIDDIKKNL
jgi:hypothetical protein